jgi:hypothetical protein
MMNPYGGYPAMPYGYMAQTEGGEKNDNMAETDSVSKPEN